MRTRKVIIYLFKTKSIITKSYKSNNIKELFMFQAITRIIIIAFKAYWKEN